MSTSSIGVAVIGAGMAGRAHASGYRSAPAVFDPGLPDVRLVAIADAHEPFAVDAARRYGYQRAETSWQAVAEAPDIAMVKQHVAQGERHVPRQRELWTSCGGLARTQRKASGCCATS